MPAKVFRDNAAVTDDFLTSKRDRRLIKHSSFLSRVRDSSDKISKSKKRTRRPSKKITSLDGLGDALPDLDDDAAESATSAKTADGKIRHRSLKTRPGALKKKEKLVRGEMDRFASNWARLADAPADAPEDKMQDASDKTDAAPSASGTSAAPATANRWAALRGFISATMEQNPAFANK